MTPDQLMALVDKYTFASVHAAFDPRKAESFQEAQAALRSALEQVAADSERYRWLKLNGVTPGQRPAAEEMPLGYKPIRLRVDTAVYLPATWNADVDAAIDQARKASNANT